MCVCVFRALVVYIGAWRKLTVDAGLDYVFFAWDVDVSGLKLFFLSLSSVLCSRQIQIET